MATRNGPTDSIVRYGHQPRLDRGYQPVLGDTARPMGNGYQPITSVATPVPPPPPRGGSAIQPPPATPTKK